MASTIERVSRRRVAEVPVERRSHAVQIWAGIGAAFVALQVYVWGSWLLSGPEHISRFHDHHNANFWFAVFFQALFVVILVPTWILLARQCRRHRRFTLDAMLIVGMLSIWWQDPLYSWFRPGFLYSSNLVNIESWLPHVPLTQPPYANLMPEPVLWGFGAYGSIFVVQIIAMCWLMRRVRDRWWTSIGPLGMFFLVAGLGFVADAVFEIPMLWTRIYAYPAAWQRFAIFGGRPYQLPLFHLAAGALFFSSLAALRFWRNDRGETVVERGAEGISNPRRRTVARTLAIVGFVNVMSLAYYVPVFIQIASTDAFPKGYERWQVNGWCGDQGQPYGPCPAPGVNWKVRPDNSVPHPSEIYKKFPYFQQPATVTR